MLQQVTCDHGAVEIIERIFADCVYNARDMLGFCAGLASICCWLVAQMPQLWRNYKSQSAEALSPWFLAEWLLGDTFNLLGALLKGDQLPTVVFTAQYFICVDAIMMVQYLYYMSLQRRRERMLAARRHRHHHHHHHRRHHHLNDQHAAAAVGGSSSGGAGRQQQQQGEPTEGRPPALVAGATAAAAGQYEHADDAEIVGGSDGGASASSRGARGAAAGVTTRDVVFRPQRALQALGALLLVSCLQPGGSQRQQQQRFAAAGGAAAGGGGAGAEPAKRLSARRLLQAASVGLSLAGGGGRLSVAQWSYTVGTVLGYCSSALYLTSRLSQIWKNHRRQSAEGLAISMFLCAIAANTLYGASILIRSYTWQELSSSLPWLIGSLGTVALDLTIFAQSRALAAGQKHHPSDEDEPLLLPAAA